VNSNKTAKSVEAPEAEVEESAEADQYTKRRHRYHQEYRKKEQVSEEVDNTKATERPKLLKLPFCRMCDKAGKAEEECHHLYKDCPILLSRQCRNCLQWVSMFGNSVGDYLPILSVIDHSRDI
jgi:hypothetical protein